jgi:predicted transcriptional regulator YdeE
MWYPKFQSDLPMSEPTTMFFTGVEVAPGTISLEGMAIKALPESLYAVFEEHQRGVIGGPNGAAYRMWLPNSGYVLNDAIPGDLEDYPDVEHVGYHDVCKIWIPICSR